MTELQYLDKFIEEKLLAENKKERELHEPSGKLSASRLAQPIQWQVLHTIGVPTKELEEFTIRKFERGNHVEEWLVSNIPGLVNKQKFVEYRDCIGFADALVDMRDWNLDIDTIPHEIKSVSNANYKWIKRDGVKHGHALQGALYALALGSDYFAIDYVASDDYRVMTFLENTTDYKQEIDKIIDNYNKAREDGVVPVFEPTESWTDTDKYNSYLEFKNLGPIEIELLLQEKYPEAYKKLKGGNNASNS